MKLVTEVRTIDVVSETGTVGQTEGLAGLLTDVNASRRSCRAIVLTPLCRVGEGLDGCAELLSGNQVEVLDVVRVLCGGLCARRCLRNGNKSVPSHTRVIDAVVGGVQNTTIDTGLKETLADLIPLKLHG